MYKDIIEKYANEIVELNDYMADNPEIGGEEYKSSRRIVELLSNKGFEVEYPFAGLDTSFKASINKGKTKKAAILVEYDALRGLGHACGHCASGSISILAALVLNEMKDSIDAQIDIIGTPDEEMRGSKVVMANNSIFDGYDFAIMMHMHNKNFVYSGTLALDAYDFEFTGHPAHAAAAPWEGRNALNAIRLMFDAVDMMRQHVKDDVKIHGFIKNGGKASNIVPDYTSAEFCVRSKNRTYLDDISQWVMDCARAAALATRTELKITQVGEKYNELFRKATGDMVLEELYADLDIKTVDLSHIIGGSSDIGNVDYICPAFHPYISIGEDFGTHTVEFADSMKNDKTHDAILNGAEIVAKFIVRLYDEPELLERIKEEHRMNRGK